MKKKWETPKIINLSLRDTKTPGQKGNTQPFERTVRLNGEITATTSS